MGYHDVMVELDVVEGWIEETHYANKGSLVAKDDPRWPTRCTCGYEFLATDQKQVFESAIYRRADTGEEMALRDAPAGAMWDAFWMGRKGPDGKSLAVQLPGNHVWLVDGPCSNCPWKDREHQCWARHGTPPDITVDKNGNSCPVGAGSIIAGNYHGMLENGYLRQI